MKTLSAILAVSFLFLGAGLKAQTAPVSNKAATPVGVPEVRKGYYSIGNNAAKLNTAPTSVVTISEDYPTMQKGYYSIGNNNRKLTRPILINSLATNFVPFVGKGYYSIGRNNEKLKQ